MPFPFSEELTALSGCRKPGCTGRVFAVHYGFLVDYAFSVGDLLGAVLGEVGVENRSGDGAKGGAAAALFHQTRALCGLETVTSFRQRFIFI